MKLKYLTTIVLSLFILSGCYYDNFEELNTKSITDSSCADTSGTVAYNPKVKTIITSYCGSTGSSASGCHGVGSSSGIPLTTFQQVSDAAADNLLNSIKQNGSASNMPKNGGKLSDCQIAVIEKWINTGKLEN